MRRRNFLRTASGLLIPAVCSPQIYTPILQGGRGAGGPSLPTTLEFPVVGGISLCNPFSSMGITGADATYDWGDGSQSTMAASGSVPSHNYPASSLYTLRVSASWPKVTRFIISGAQGTGANPYTGQAQYSGENPRYPAPMPSLRTLTGLTHLESCDTWWSGPSGDFSFAPNLAYIDLQGNNFACDLPSFAACTKLQYAELHYCGWTGQLPSFAACTQLVHLSLNTAQHFDSTIPSFAACTQLQDLWAGNAGIWRGQIPSFAACTDLRLMTFYGGVALNDTVPGSFATQKNLSSLDLFYNSLPSAAVNQILADLRASLSISGRVACTVNLAGNSNAQPTGQGITDKATLISAGWTVATT